MKRTGIIFFVVLLIVGTMWFLSCSNSSNETQDTAVVQDSTVAPATPPPAVAADMAESPRPEIHGTFVKLELPDECFWVQRWNTPGYFAEDCSKDSKLGGTKDEWDGVSYDAHLLVNPEVKDGKAFFRLDLESGTDVKRYFRLGQLTSDPRLTNWWLAFSNDSFPNLREAVAQSAACKDYPQITDAIIQNMVACKVVSSERINSLSNLEINDVLKAYASLGYEQHLAKVKDIIGKRQLTAQTFSTLTAGDTLNLYYDNDFGAVLYPISTLVVSNNTGGNVTAYVPEDEGISTTLQWNDLERLSGLIEVRKSARGTI